MATRSSSGSPFPQSPKWPPLANFRQRICKLGSAGSEILKHPLDRSDLSPPMFSRRLSEPAFNQAGWPILVALFAARVGFHEETPTTSNLVLLPKLQNRVAQFLVQTLQSLAGNILGDSSIKRFRNAARDTRQCIRVSTQ
jgi:hypothetical protein